VAEMLGVTFEGHPDPRPLLLPDDWEGGAPLRQDFAVEDE
jgi:NADH-quinone oxidoreductase subunit C